MTTVDNGTIITRQKMPASIEESQKLVGKIKASLFNLVIFSNEEWRTDYFNKIVETTLEKVPCRIFFIQVTKSEYFEVLEETIGEADKSNVCDLILIKSDQKSLQRIPSILLPLLISDLPIYLLWGEDPVTEQTLLPQLQKIADRLIVVSDCCKGIQKFAKDLLDYSNKLKIDLIDINWALLSGWRDILVPLFSNTEEAKTLNYAKKVCIAYNSRADHLKYPYLRAAFLQSWIAAQLQWKFDAYSVNDGAQIITYLNTNNQKVEVKLIPQEQDALFPGALISFCLESTNHAECIKIQRQDIQFKVTVTRSDEIKCDMPYTLPLPQARRPQTFIRELFFQSPSKFYRSMLTKIAEIPWE